MQNGHPVAKKDAGKDIRYDDRGSSYVIVDAPRAYDLIMNARFGTNTDCSSRQRAAASAFYDFAFESCEVPSGARDELRLTTRRSHRASRRCPLACARSRRNITSFCEGGSNMPRSSIAR